MDRVPVAVQGGEAADGRGLWAPCPARATAHPIVGSVEGLAPSPWASGRDSQPRSESHGAQACTQCSPSS